MVLSECMNIELEQFHWTEVIGIIIARFVMAFGITFTGNIRFNIPVFFALLPAIMKPVRIVSCSARGPD